MSGGVYDPVDTGFKVFQTATKMLACAAYAARASHGKSGGDREVPLKDLLSNTITRFRQLPALLANWGLRATIIYYLSHASKSLENSVACKLVHVALDNPLKCENLEFGKTRKEDTIDTTSFSYLTVVVSLASILPYEGKPSKGPIISRVIELYRILESKIGKSWLKEYLVIDIFNEIVRAVSNPSIERLRPLLSDASIVAARLAESTYTPLVTMLKEQKDAYRFVPEKLVELLKEGDNSAAHY